jgi:hypothetical protein
MMCMKINEVSGFRQNVIIPMRFKYKELERAQEFRSDINVRLTMMCKKTNEVSDFGKSVIGSIHLKCKKLD